MRVINKSIVRKLLVSNVIPMIAAFSLMTLLILSLVGNIVKSQTNEIIERSTVSAAAEVNDYFTEYCSLVQSAAVEQSYSTFMADLKPGVRVDAASEFSAVKARLAALAALDSENIMAVWIADADSSQLMQSDGYVSKEDWAIKDRPWYAATIQNGTVTLTEPYTDTASGNTIVSAIAPVLQGGTVVGFLGADISLNHLTEILSGLTLGDTGYFTFFTSGKNVIYSGNPDNTLKNVSELTVGTSVQDAVMNGSTTALTYQDNGITVHGYVTGVGDINWTVLSALPNGEYYSQFNQLRNLLLSTILIVLAVLITVLFFMSKAIVKPLKALAIAAESISQGNLDVNLDILTGDETRLVADAFNKTVEQLRKYISYIEEITALLNEMGNGNLNLEFHHTYEGGFAAIRQALLQASGHLNSTLLEFREAADQFSSGSAQVAAGAQAQAQGATEQASSIEELAATMGEVSEQVKQSAVNAEKACDCTRVATEAVQRGQQQMNDMVASMHEIDTTSHEIGKIIKNIDDIAFQTNILALNAAVEAARAGSAGRGFAVVADEVRNLAGKTAESAKSTSALIESALTAVGKGVKHVSDTVQSLEEIVQINGQTAEMVALIADSSEQQSHSIEQINIGFEQISSVVQTNSATAEESAAASEELSSQANRLRELISEFQLVETGHSGKNGMPQEP